MGRYIDDILQPGEKVLYSTNAHWIFYLPAIAAWILALALYLLSRGVERPGAATMWLGAGGGGRPGVAARWVVLAGAAALVALLATAKAWFHVWTTETDVTNLRVVHKTGFIKRRTFEMSLDKVESVDVDEDILGRILNYGNASIRGVGADR